MTKASEWADGMKKHQLARPTLVVTVLDADGNQNAGEREIAFVIGYEGVPRLHFKRGGTIAPDQAIKLALWILDTFEDRT
jgi:hypothetical protein